MPYVSDSQRRAFHALLAEGKISKATVDEFDRASKGKKLPEHVKPKKNHIHQTMSRAVGRG